MKTSQMTKGLIYSYNEQIEQMKRNGNVGAYLMKGRIDDFYKDWNPVLDSIFEDIRAIQEHCMVIVDNVIQQTEPDAEGKTQPIFKAGKTKEMLDAMWVSLMSTPAIMKWKMPEEEPVQSEAGIAPVIETPHDKDPG